MKTVIGLAVALALMVSAGPATTGDTFEAFSKMPAAERARLTPLGDDQLSTIEGASVLALIQPLIGVVTDRTAMLTSEIVLLIQTQLHTEPPAAVQFNVVEVTQRQLHTEPPAAVQFNVVEVTQRPGNTVSFTRQTMW